MKPKNASALFQPASLQVEAEQELINIILNSFSGDLPIRIQRLLSVYPTLPETGKDIAILNFFESFCSLDAELFSYSVYRDWDVFLSTIRMKKHFRHQFEVFLLGMAFLSVILKNDLWPHKRRNQEEIIETWFLTATLHDIGYPIQVYKEISDKLSELYKGTGITGLSDMYSIAVAKYCLSKDPSINAAEIVSSDSGEMSVINIIDYLEEIIQKTCKIEKEKIKSVLKEKKGEANHAYVSSIIFLKKYLTYLSGEGLWSSSLDEIREYVLNQVATAIVLHNPGKLTKWWQNAISFSNAPCARMLYIIDNLQEWGRYGLYSDRWPNYTLTTFKMTSEGFKFEYTLNHSSWNTDLKKEAKNYITQQVRKIRSIVNEPDIAGIQLHISYSTNTGEKVYKTKILF